MPEAILIMLDNSQYSINGDYMPTRWASQIDCAGLLIQARTQQHHQNAIGLALMAGNQVEIICTPTTDSTKVTAYLYGVKQCGIIKFTQAIQIGALALKHRSDPTLKQRMIIFIASTITDNIQEIKLIAKKLKKNQIAVDLVAIGDLSPQQKQKINTFWETVNHDGNSSARMLEPTNSYLSDQLIGKEIFGGSSNMIFEEDDPQLAMVLKMSLQEDQPQVHPESSEKFNEQQLEKKALQLSLEAKDQKDKPKDKDDKDNHGNNEQSQMK